MKSRKPWKRCCVIRFLVRYLVNQNVKLIPQLLDFFVYFSLKFQMIKCPVIFLIIILAMLWFPCYKKILYGSKCQIAGQLIKTYQVSHHIIFFPNLNVFSFFIFYFITPTLLPASKPQQVSLADECLFQHFLMLLSHYVSAHAIKSYNVLI